MQQPRVHSRSARTGGAPRVAASRGRAHAGQRARGGVRTTDRTASASGRLAADLTVSDTTCCGAAAGEAALLAAPFSPRALAAGTGDSAAASGAGDATLVADATTGESAYVRGSRLTGAGACSVSVTEVPTGPRMSSITSITDFPRVAVPSTATMRSPVVT